MAGAELIGAECLPCGVFVFAGIQIIAHLGLLKPEHGLAQRFQVVSCHQHRARTTMFRDLHNLVCTGGVLAAVGQGALLALSFGL